MRRGASLTRRGWIAVGAAVAVLAHLAAAQGQQTTEQFIPLGQSPGVSNTVTTVATIAAVDAQARTITLTGAPPGRAVAVTDRTRIWLDRSGMNRSNVSGTFANLAAGLQAEVKYVDPANRSEADWIKVIPLPAQ